MMGSAKIEDLSYLYRFVLTMHVSRIDRMKGERNFHSCNFGMQFMGATS